jgi:outer membrane receptor protein involved in Fe transport
VLFNIGLRYDFLNPTADRPMIEAIPVVDSAYRFTVPRTVHAKVKQQLSPRFGAAMQVAEYGYLFINLGWYFQYPLFSYLYSGLDRAALGRGISALTGNPDLEPERTKMWEISFKYALPQNLVASATYFRKESTNLVDTKTFVPGDSKQAGGYGFAEYVNNPYADARGFEVVLSRERGDWVTGELSYTYMVAEGVSGSSTDGFYIAQYGLPPGRRVFPLSWDQTHTVKGLLTVSLPWGMAVTGAFDWHSGRPYTEYPTATGFEKIDGGRFFQNNARMPRYMNIDLKVEQRFSPSWWPGGYIVLAMDCRNLTEERNVAWMDSNGRIGGELSDPSGYYIGRRTSLGIRAEF